MKLRVIVALILLFISPLIAQGPMKAPPPPPPPPDAKPPAGPVKTQPILVMLHTRFEDHVTMSIGEDRLFRTIRLVEKLKKDYPSIPFSVSCEFSGAFAQQLTKTPTTKGYLAQIKSLVDSGIVDIGYIGEDEPTYRNRPKAALTKEMSPEQRWLAQYDAAKNSLNDYRDPLTGELDSSRPGALRSVIETLGQPTVFGVFAPKLGGEAPYYHELRRMNIQAVVPGFPDPYFTMAIHGYRESASQLGKAMAAVPEASSEVFWDSGFLRASFTSSNDIRRFSAEEGKDALVKLLEKLDRSRVRVLQIEVVSYARYLEKWPDGTPKLYPLTWAYDHPDDPMIPSGIRAFSSNVAVDKAHASEEEALRYLFAEFLPANPGSRIVSPRELMKMATTPVNSDISAEQLKKAAEDWKARNGKLVNMSPTFVEANGTYLSAADLFQLLANALAGLSNKGKLPEKVHLTDIYGPLSVDQPESTVPTAEFTVSEIARTAAQLAPQSSDQKWQPLPVNVVPAKVEMNGQRLNSAQFLALMVDAYLTPAAETKIKLRYLLPTTDPGYFFPRQNGVQDSGNMWTLRPAVLKLE